MSTATLLVELFTEELPPKSLAKLGVTFSALLRFHLEEKRNMLSDNSQTTHFATPRRLAVSITNVRSVAPDREFSERLMPVAVGLDKDGNATPALLKKLATKSLGHIKSVELLRESDGKVDQLVYRGTAKGQSLQVALQGALEEAIAGLPVPKVMSYQLADGVTTVQFVRPAHGLVALHGADVVPVHALGLDAGRTTHGHRFQGAADIELKHADEYEARLEKDGKVIASFDARKITIKKLLQEATLSLCATGEDTSLGPSEGYENLLNEVTALVEMPTVYAGQFEKEFLEVPAECLVLTMKLNQKYFPLYLTDGALSSRFLIVSNMRLDNPKNVIEGNERVIRPRLSDARFFFETDKKTKLADRIPELASVIYHNMLGSQGERVEHVRAIAKAIAALTSNAPAFSGHVDRAAYLATADLVTKMVGEFPELQGTMGKYYALNEGVSPEVADAIEDHYKPRFAGDSLPRNKVGEVVALADKLATLAGMFSIGQLPTGDKDPFALRRQAIGVVRILVERQLAIDISALVAAAAQQFGSSILVPNNPAINDEIAASVRQKRLDTGAKLTAFIFERLAFLLKEQGFSAQEVDAVLSLLPERLSEVPKRLEAVRAFAALPQAQALASANKRIGNILKKANMAETPSEPEEDRLHEPAEIALYAAMRPAIDAAKLDFDKGCYSDSLKNFAQLREAVDAFFESVMVNDVDKKIRNNRLALLATLHREMNKVADLSKLAT